MLDKCRIKLNEAGFEHPYDLEVADLNAHIAIEKSFCSGIMLNASVRTSYQQGELIKQIYEGLEKSGVVIIVEKILAEDSSFNRDFINYYYEMKKRHHYSEMEIAQKREALENVLIPYKISENTALFRNAGFEHCEVFFKWYNFAGIIAKKF